LACCYLAPCCFTPKDQQDALNATKILHPVWLPIATGVAESLIKAGAENVDWIRPGQQASVRVQYGKKYVFALAVAFFLTPISIDTKGWVIDNCQPAYLFFAPLQKRR
jgi:hypothetical protein